MPGKTLTGTFYKIYKVLRIAIGHIDTNKTERWNSIYNLLQFKRIVFARARAHGHMFCKTGNCRLKKCIPCIHAVMLVHGGYQAMRCQRTCHFKSTYRIHISRHNGHAFPVCICILKMKFTQERYLRAGGKRRTFWPQHHIFKTKFNIRFYAHDKRVLELKGQSLSIKMREKNCYHALKSPFFSG